MKGAVLAGLAAATLLIGGCATTQHFGDPSPGDALGQPLTDLNITREDIPDALKAIVADPYKLPAPAGCPTITAEIAVIDQLLGPDIDIVLDPKTARAERENAAVSSLVSQFSTSWIPGRDIIRTLSGAQAHTRKVREAVLAGSLRRAFLKGMSRQLACPPVPPAASPATSPLPSPAPPP